MARSQWPVRFVREFFGEQQKGRPKPFQERMLTFLQAPIQFRDPDTGPVYIILEAIQPIRTEVELQLVLRFRLSGHPALHDAQPVIGEVAYSQTFDRSYAEEGEDSDVPVYWYPLTNLNTASQNIANLASFAIANWNSP